jgi:hypothetical protein
LASNRLRWEGGDLLALIMVVLLAELGWGNLWHLAAGTDWFRPLAEDWFQARPASLPSLPYTQPRSPAGWLWRDLNRGVGWWRESFWPQAGPAVVGLAASAILTLVLSVLLPGRLRPLNAAMVALVGLGVALRRRGRNPLLGRASVQVGLSWLAGHAALAEIQAPSLVLALAYVMASWGLLRIGEGRRGGSWLLNGGQVAGVALLAALKQPLAAGAVGMLLFGQVVMQPLLHFEPDVDRGAVSRRMWPWLMAAMLVAAVAIP